MLAVVLMCAPCFFFWILEANTNIAGSEAIAPHACFCFCASHFCGKEILDHKEHYVFTILFFPQLGRGLESEWYWLSVARDFLFYWKNHNCLLVHSFLLWHELPEKTFSWQDCQVCQSCLPVVKGKCNVTLSLGGAELLCRHLQLISCLI